MKKILLIEDNYENRENTAELLQLSGYAVITAPDGQEGISLAREKKPDLILCDVRMPLASGHEVFEELQREETTKKIPFFFISASVERQMVQSALDLGAKGYICKPFDEKELLDTIRENQPG